MDRKVLVRKKWINFYLETKDAGFVCCKCDVSRPTLRKWYRRFLQHDEAGLIEQSKRPHSSPNQKLNSERNKHFKFT